MAVSGTFTFTVTRDDLVREAMLNIGKIGQTDSPTAQETTDCVRKLNMMVKQWMGKIDYAPGLKLWTRARADLFLSSTRYAYSLGPTGDNWAGGIAVPQPNGATYAQNQLNATALSGQPVLSFGASDVGMYTPGDFIVVQVQSGDIFSSTVLSVDTVFGTVTMNGNLPVQATVGAYVWNYTTKAQRPLEIVTAVLRDNQFNDTPMNYMTLETYEQLPSKVMPSFLSDPTAIYYEASIGRNVASSNGTLYIDCGGAQDVTKHLHIVYLQPVMDFNNPLDNPEYPQEWYRALAWGLSKEICPMFNAPWTEDMMFNWREAMELARHSNTETTQMYFQPYSGSPYEP